MRILVIADIHSNWPALTAIDEKFDACLFLGDLVDYATDPIPCIEWVRHKATSVVRGNHDHSVAQRVIVRPGGTFRKMVSAMRPHHFNVLNDEQLTWLAQMPVTRHLVIGDHRFLLVHATPRDPMDEYIGDNVEQWQQRLEHVDVDFVCVGHTHIPMQLQIGKTQVINPGSVGQPTPLSKTGVWSFAESPTTSIARFSTCEIQALKKTSSQRLKLSSGPAATLPPLAPPNCSPYICESYW